MSQWNLIKIYSFPPYFQHIHIFVFRFKNVSCKIRHFTDLNLDLKISWFIFNSLTSLNQLRYSKIQILRKKNHASPSSLLFLHCLDSEQLKQLYKTAIIAFIDFIIMDMFTSSNKEEVRAQLCTIIILEHQPQPTGREKTIFYRISHINTYA